MIISDSACFLQHKISTWQNSNQKHRTFPYSYSCKNHWLDYCYACNTVRKNGVQDLRTFLTILITRQSLFVRVIYFVVHQKIKIKKERFSTHKKSHFIQSKKKHWCSAHRWLFMKEGFLWECLHQICTLTWLVAWINSCALTLLARLASSILKSRAVTEKKNNRKDNIVECRRRLTRISCTQQFRTVAI